MVKVGLITLLSAMGVATVTVHQALAEPTPLMPHPPERLTERPHYSQDKYKRESEAVPDEPQIVYSQDKYASPDTGDDYSDQLRNVPAKGREWSEIEIAKGIVALNAANFAEAVKHFQAALKQDPRNFVAYEYISSVYERQNDFSNAIGYLARAKHIAPRGRWGQIDFQIGRIYLMAKNYERAEIYLRLALDQGGQPTAVNYTLGYLLYLRERFFEAERYLHEARMRATRRTALANERDMQQAIDYYLGEIYARLGFTQYAIICLRNTEIGDSWEVRQAAWRVHSELNHLTWYATLGTYGQYDSNVVLVPIDGTLPADFATQAGDALVFTANAGAQTSPAKKWVAGIDGMFYLNTHLSQALAAFDVLNYGLDLWGSYWNQRDWQFTGRYDLSNVLSDRTHYTRFQTTSGPLVSAAYFPFQRWNWEFGFQLRSNNFATDLPSGPDQRSGTTYVGFFRTTLKSPNPRFRPTLGYTFESDVTNGQNFSARSHILLAEADWRLFEKTHVIGSVTFTKSYYPDHIQGRRDTVQQVRLGLNHLFSPHWVGLFDITGIEDDSTLLGYSYKRTIVTAGATYTF